MTAHDGLPVFDGATYRGGRLRQPGFDQRHGGHYDKLTGRRFRRFLALLPVAARAAGQDRRGNMTLPSIDIDALPLLDTAVGLFGSLVGESVSSGPSVFEIAVTIAMIIYD